jgi:shikimate kinase/3-dehydroquinate synthase
LNKPPENIILIGYKAAGKTTIGRILSKILNYQFIDTDEQFREIYQESIPEFYKKNGEAKFRACEAKIIEKLIRVNQAVIATGGGVTECLENRLRLKVLGSVFYLKSEFFIIEQRLKQLGRVPEFVNFSHFARRDEQYLELAHDIILCEQQNPQDIARLIMGRLGDRYGK